MVNQATLALLIAAANAATGPLPKDNSVFPKFASTVTPSAAGDWNAGNSQVLDGFSKSGTTLAGNYRAYRNNLYVFPTQSISAKGASQAVQAQTTGKRAFYENTSTMLGDYPALATDAVGTNMPTTSHWVACTAIVEVKNCPGGVGYGAAASIALSARIIMKAGVSGQISAYGGGSSAAFTWQQDLVMASFYNP